MRNLISSILFFLIFNMAFSQDPVINPNSGEIHEIDFEQFSGLFGSGVESVPFDQFIWVMGYNWPFAGDPPSVCNVDAYNYVLPYTTVSPSGGDLYGSLEKKVIDGDIVEDQNFTGTIEGLPSTGGQYELTLSYINLGSSTAETAGEFTSQFIVRFGDDQTYIFPFPTYHPLAEWHTIVVSFCATEETMPFTITAPDFLGNYDNASCVMGIDNISISTNSSGSCSGKSERCDCASFIPVPGKKYFVSGWTKVMVEGEEADSEEGEEPYIGITFEYDGIPPEETPEFQFYPTGEKIDRWQRVAGEFTIPEDADDINIELVANNNPGKETFFDDVRIHPSEGNMKSFVYDQQSHKLMAELDDNNYATFYEYDKEGGLVRVKKETEKGVFTIQESRSGTKKSE